MSNKEYASVNRSVIILMLVFLLVIVSSCRSQETNTDTQTPGEFTYNGHSYKIVKTALSWQDANAAAKAENGYLVNIDSVKEDAKIYTELVKFIKDSEFSATAAPDGGGASYVWIGANDIEMEGSWKWANDGMEFWKGDKSGTAVSGHFNNWGHKNENQNEPDNFSHENRDQDGAAIALTQWPLSSGNLGSASQWNDVDINNKLFYVVEFDQIK